MYLSNPSATSRMWHKVNFSAKSRTRIGDRSQITVEMQSVYFYSTTRLDICLIKPTNDRNVCISQILQLQVESDSSSVFKWSTTRFEFRVFLFLDLAQSAGAIEYADFITEKGVRSHTHECPRYDTKLHLMMRLQFWSFGNVEYLFTAITPRSTLRECHLWVK